MSNLILIFPNRQLSKLTYEQKYEQLKLLLSGNINKITACQADNSPDIHIEYNRINMELTINLQNDLTKSFPQCQIASNLNWLHPYYNYIDFPYYYRTLFNKSSWENIYFAGQGRCKELIKIADIATAANIHIQNYPN